MKIETMILLEKLQSGCYLRKRVNHSGKDGFVLLMDKESPVSWYKSNIVKPLLNVLKQEKGNYILSPALVLKQHGNSSIKKRYKLLRGKSSSNET